ncbi:hypothetical protein [Roseateles sp. BYS87W]|uniref:HTH cro/C1-type domain-containing protein n=1 Tax=Pelomonas baiyunensis TaxID=3299026 RepID=A0ABW7GSZ8_9BURK
MESYADRLNQALAASGLTKSQFTTAMGLSYQAIAKALEGKSKAFSASNHLKAASLLGVSATWLANGLGEKHDAIATLGRLNPTEVRLVALLRMLPEEVRNEAIAAFQRVASLRLETAQAVLNASNSID